MVGRMPTKLAPGIREKRPGYFEVCVYGGLDPATGKPRQVSRTVRGSVRDANALRVRRRAGRRGDRICIGACGRSGRRIAASVPGPV